MSNTFAQLKKSRKTQYDKLVSEVAKMQNKGQTDDRFWQPSTDKAGNGYAVIRFLPAPSGEDFPWVRLFSHGFKGPTGQWYIENSLTTFGQDDPVGEYNTKLWNRGDEAGKEQARAQKRKLTYISNIRVIKDSANPENEGKVFYFRYGKKIFDKINDAMHPAFEDETPINPFDFWEGANFKLKIRQVEGYRNYDNSEFDQISPLSDDDDELEQIWKSQYSLQEFVDSKNFKSYSELSAKLAKVMGWTDAPEKVPGFEDEDFQENSAPVEKEDSPPFDIDDSNEEDDDSLKMFQRLTEED